MPRARTGAVSCKAGVWSVRCTIQGDARPAFKLPTCTTETEARERGELLARMAGELVRAGQADLAPRIVARAAASAPGKDLDAVKRLVAAVIKGVYPPPSPAAASSAVTFGSIAARWLSGELHREHPDRIPLKKTSDTDEHRLRRHILPLLEHVDITAIRLEEIEAVMRALPSTLSKSTRRHVAMLCNRILGFAVYPLRLIAANPIPRAWAPSGASGKALTHLYPDEDAKLLACVEIPLGYRMLYGFLAREGMRASEALGLQWRDLDLERGAVTLDVNKTLDPRAWALSADVAAALRAWRGDAGDDDLVFAERGMSYHAARRFRAHLELAGVTRAHLHERSATRLPIRMHDLRATFVTVSLACGRSEAWVCDRTGHRSSVMLNKYRRAARAVAELNLGGFAPLDAAVPELGPGPETVPETDQLAAGAPSEMVASPGNQKTLDAGSGPNGQGPSKPWTPTSQRRSSLAGSIRPKSATLSCGTRQPGPRKAPSSACVRGCPIPALPQGTSISRSR